MNVVGKRTAAPSGPYADSAEAATDLGVALAEQGRLEEAIAHLRSALRIQPDYAKAHHNLGVALAQQGKHDEAVQSLEHALRIKPDYAEAFYNLGNVLLARRKHAEAADRYREALRVRCDYFDAYNNLGLALTKLGRSGEAVVVLHQAVRLRPASAEALNNLGLALADQGRFREADDHYHQALRIKPDFPDAHVNLGTSYKEQGRTEEAVACYDQALRLNPEAASARWNRGLVWLQAGDFERGWPEYEWRWQRQETPPRPFRQPRWDGSPLAGQTILLHVEQGLGDMIQFIRYAPQVRDCGGRVAVNCPGYLLKLLSRCPGIDHLVAEGSPLPEFDVQAPLMSLPGIFRTTLATVPAQVPYLFAAPELVERWRQELGRLQGFKVGIAWQGNPYHPWDRHRSIPLAEFGALAQLPRVRLVSLQRVHGLDQLRIAVPQFAVTELPEDIDTASGAFMDTAAVMQSLDLIITPDTALAHLAGALGVPVWVGISAITDWRWLSGRQDSPWYPSMRLFRQPRLGDWPTVFARMADELGRLSAAGTLAVSVEITPGEFLDRICRLQIESDRTTDPGQRSRLRAELAALAVARGAIPHWSAEVDALATELRSVHAALRETEDGLRACEQAEDVGPRFVEFSRLAQRCRDRRETVIGRINDMLGARPGGSLVRLASG